METVYKAVLRVLDQNEKTIGRVSVAGHFEGDIPDEWTLFYQTLIPTVPIIGKLFAFKTEQDARDFVRKYGGSEIWKATTSRSKPAKFVACATPDIALFWGNDPYALTIPAPEGTLMCDDITLTELLWERPLS